MQIYNSSQNQNQEKPSPNELSDFLQESSIRDRLRSLPSVSTHAASSDNVDISRVMHLFSDIEQNSSSIGFKQTLKEIIMVPFIENNRTVSKGSKM